MSEETTAFEKWIAEMSKIRTVRAISIRQPWASLIVAGFKGVENRPRRTFYRGPIFIHASKTFDFEGEYYLIHHRRELGIDEDKDSVRFLDTISGSHSLRGGIIGGANLTDCVQSHPSPWFSGRWGYVMEKVVPFTFYPCKGQLGIFHLEIELNSFS